MIRRRAASLSAAFALVAASTLGVTFTSSAQAVSAGAATPSAITKTGSGAFGGLRVSVSQTENLIDQVVQVAWSGGTQSQPGGGQFSINFLQIMQCWGDDAAGPSREQCQYGGLLGDPRGGGQVPTRQVNYGSTLVDPLETIKQAPGSFRNVYVPFRSVTGKVEEGTVSEFFDVNTTNEVPFAQTRSRGEGQDFFNVQTIREASGLGCGEPRTKAGKTTGRSCWLVVVPRNDREVDGSQRTISSNDQLISSPLSASNWKNRIVFPLKFEPIGRPCPLGQEERKTAGQENVAEAITRWQPALCLGGGPVFSYSQVSDDIARRELKTENPGLTFLSDPLPKSEVPDGVSVLYAPVALSGLTIGFNVESQSPFRAPAEIKQKDGERITKMRLTPRLVAKLLTQSYTRAADVTAPSVAGNPTDMTQDPEFKALNPNFEGLRMSLPELLLPFGRSDAAAQVWTWIKADPDASKFLAGTSDQWGMEINTNYKDLELPRDDYPKSENYCRAFTDDRPSLCTLDAHPYSADNLDAAKAAARGDTLARTNWDPLAEPPAWKKSPPLPSGTRAIMALVDTASAARYGLETAEIRNAGGAYVAPTIGSLQAAAGEMKAGENSQVLESNPTTTNPKAYPLAALTYAATVPEVLSSAAKKDYSAFLKYAAGRGQIPGVEPGQLPFGYAPLTADLKSQTTKAAQSLASASPATSGGAGAGGGTPDGSTGGLPAGADGAAAGDPGAAGGADGGVLGRDQAINVALTTPIDGAGAARLVPLLALVLGLLAAVGGPVLLRYSRTA